jgi:hypothetical protein
MSSIALFELLAAIAAFVAAVFIGDQHVHRPRPYKLLWTLGLAFYGIAAAAAFAGAAGGWTSGEYKAWYFFGGILTAAYLGLGSLHLLAPRRAAMIVTAIAAVITVYAAVRVAMAPVTIPEQIAHDTLAVTNVTKFHPLPGDLTVAAIVMNIPGALFLFGGAAWSAWTFWRHHTPGYRLLSMVLLALGSVFPSFLTGLQRLGYTSAAALGEFLGALCLLAGLVISLDVFTTFRIPFTSIVIHERTAPAQAAETVRG